MGIELREQLVGHRCRPRYHSQRADFRQIRDQIIGHPISEVVLFLVPRTPKDFQAATPRANYSDLLSPCWRSLHGYNAQ